MRKQDTDATQQKLKITLAVTFRTEFGGIKYEENITQIQIEDDQDLTLAIEQRKRGRYNSFSGSGKIQHSTNPLKNYNKVIQLKNNF